MPEQTLTPSFFILGVQKGGTSTLHKYLSESDELFFPFKKELHFFDAYYSKGMKWYHDKFIAPAGKQYKHAGEATPYYFFHPEIPKRIYKEFPTAKFVILFRNPIERAFSHYQMSVRRELENRSFDEAINNEARYIRWQRFKMRWNKKFNLKHVEKSYISRGFYGKQLGRWLKLFPRESFLFLKSEDFFTNPQPLVNKVCDFLDIKSINISEPEVVNAGNYNEELTNETIAKLKKLYTPDIQELEKLTELKFEWF